MILCTNILPNKNLNIWDTSLPPLPIPLFILSSPRSVTSDSLKAVGLEHGLIPWTSPLHGNIFPLVLPCALPTTHKNLYSIFPAIAQIMEFLRQCKDIIHQTVLWLLQGIWPLVNFMFFFSFSSLCYCFFYVGCLVFSPFWASHLIYTVILGTLLTYLILGSAMALVMYNSNILLRSTSLLQLTT